MFENIFLVLSYFSFWSLVLLYFLISSEYSNGLWPICSFIEFMGYRPYFFPHNMFSSVAAVLNLCRLTSVHFFIPKPLVSNSFETLSVSSEPVLTYSWRRQTGLGHCFLWKEEDLCFSFNQRNLYLGDESVKGLKKK